MTKTYQTVVVGAGMGGQASMKGLIDSGRFDLVGVADWREEARQAVKAAYPDTLTFPNHNQMFAECQPDVACISTWPPTHLDVTKDALDLPLQGILVEKPLADNTAAGREILDRIQAKKLPLVVPHGLLVANHVREIIDRVQSGDIGDLRLIEIQCSAWDIINAGIHWLNFCLTLIGPEPVDYVLATADTTSRTYRDSMQVETLAVTYIQMHSGLRIVMNTGDYVKTLPEDEGVVFRLVGALGTIEFYAWAPRYRLLNAHHPSGKLFEVEPGPGTNHERYLLTLADQIDRGAPDYTIPESSLLALELCEAAYLSHYHHCAVTLPLTDFTPPPPSDWRPGQPYRGQGGGRDGRQLPPRM